jgi:hypothetical protein
MKSTHHGQQRLEDEDKGLRSLGDPAFCHLPKRTETQVMGCQLLRSGTSVGEQSHFDVSRIPETWKFPPCDLTLEL